MGQTIAAGFCSRSPGGFILSVLATPAAAIIGASKARTAGEVLAAEKSLRNALTRISPHPKLRDAVIALGLPGKSVRPYGGTTNSQDLASAHARGIDTVFEISIRRYGFITAGEIEPEVYPAVATELRVLRTRDGAELYRRRIGHVGAARKYFEVSADDGAGVGPAFDEVYMGFAARALRLAFGESATGGPPPRPTSAPMAETLRFLQPEQQPPGLCN